MHFILLMILMISFLYSLEINKVNPFPALAAPFPPPFILNLFIEFESKLLTNPGKLSPAKEIATFVSYLLAICCDLPKLASQEPKDPPD